MHTLETPSVNEKRLLILLASVQFMHILDFMVVMPLGPQLMRVMDITPAEFGWLVSTYTFSAAAAGFVGAFFIDKLDRRTALLMGCSGFIAGTLLCALADTYLLLLGGRSLAGAFGGMLYAMVLSIIGDTIPYERRGKAMGWVSMAFAVSSIVGVPFSIWIASVLSWQWSFYVIVIIAVMITGLATYAMPSIKSHIISASSQRSPTSFIAILKNTNCLLAFAFMFFLMVGQFTVIPYISPFLVNNIGFAESQLTWVYLIGGISSMITAPLIGRWADKIGKRKVFILLSLVAPIPVIWVTHLTVFSIPLALIVTTLFFVFVGGRMVPAMTMITGAVADGERGRFMSLNSMVQHIATGSGALLASFLIVENTDGTLGQFGLAGYFSVAAMIAAVAIVMKVKLNQS